MPRIKMLFRSGAAGSSYVDPQIAAASSVQRRALTELKSFMAWGRRNNAKLLLTEIGTPNTDTRWTDTLARYYEHIERATLQKTWGVLNANTLSSKQAVAAAGGKVTTVAANWSSLQPTQNGTLDPTALASLQTELSDCKTAGIKATLNLGFQYPPAWALTAIPQFVDQSGIAYSNVSSGKNIRDWIWTQAGRSAIQDFVTKVLQNIDMTALDSIRIGGGVYGELQMPEQTQFQVASAVTSTSQTTLTLSSTNAARLPQSGQYTLYAGSEHMRVTGGQGTTTLTVTRGYNGTTPATYTTATNFLYVQYWGYGAAAQTGTGVASGMSICPYPGYELFSGNATQDTAWINWYHGSLDTWMLWLIDLCSALGWTGDYYVLHPGFGVRSSWTTLVPAYRENIAKGCDWARSISAYANRSNVHPHSTWNDQAYPWRPPVNDSDRASWEKLYDVAQTYNKHLKISGENTSLSITAAQIDAVWERAMQYGRGYARFLLFDYANSAGPDSITTKITRMSLNGQNGTPVGVTYWAAGRAWGTGYPLAAYYNNSGSSVIDTAGVQAAVIEAHDNTAGSTTMRGVNLAGPEFGHSGAFSNANPGTEDVDFFYPASNDYSYLKSRGVNTVRLPIRWERIQPTLLGALNPQEVTRIQTAITQAHNQGLKIILDLHNYGRYIYDDAGTPKELVLLSTTATINTTTLTLGVQYFQDVWQRLAQTLSPKPDGYELMNEPHDLAAVTGTFSGTTRYTWDGGTVQGWVGGDGNTSLSVGTGNASTGSLQATKTVRSGQGTSGYDNIRVDDAGTKMGGTLAASNTVLGFWVKINAPSGTWKVRGEVQNSSFQWVVGTWSSTVPVNTWTYVTSTISSMPSTVNAFAVQAEANDAPANISVSLQIDTFAQGTIQSAKTAAQVWESIAQSGVDAIRTVDTTTPIIIPGYDWQHVQQWVLNHPVAWVNDPSNALYYAGHHYFDTNQSGTYDVGGETYNQAVTAANGSGGNGY